MLSSKYTELLEKYRTEKSARLELEEANQTLEEEVLIIINSLLI